MFGNASFRLEWLWHEELKRRGKDGASLSRVFWRFCQTRMLVAIFSLLITMVAGFVGPVSCPHFPSDISVGLHADLWPASAIQTLTICLNEIVQLKEPRGQKALFKNSYDVCIIFKSSDAVVNWSLTASDHYESLLNEKTVRRFSLCVSRKKSSHTHLGWQNRAG